MIDYTRYTLPNGLTVIAHRDQTTKLAAINLLYRVGARNESPQNTGFAHLFEHLMFRGTRQVPDFDIPIQEACGENNAFTTNDYTNYYITLPKDNVQTALWLEADRMTGLDISRETLDTEKMVVIEEFNQRYLNQPYGDQWLLLRDMVYTAHPYRWPTIGLTPDHIRNASMTAVKDFYRRYYVPSNAVLAVAGDIAEEEILAMAEKWFGDLPSVPQPEDALPVEPRQIQGRRKEVERNVPATQITIAFVTGPRGSENFYRCDFITDLLAGGTSARLYQRLVKERKLFSSVNAYITGDIDPGMFVVTGQLMPGVTVEDAQDALWDEFTLFCSEPPQESEMEKVKNKFEANTIFGELNVMNKALNLSYYTMLGDTALVNQEVGIYRAITPQDIAAIARELFRPELSSTLVIHGKK